MSDRELLELAAKAAGLATRPDWYDALLGVAVVSKEQPFADRWNPLEIDSEALRLAVKLRMDVQVWHDEVRCTTTHRATGDADATEAAGDNLDAAARRAIVRCAAEIGKTP
jgi:hypothetical protein